jgi:hypothetical protein
VAAEAERVFLPTSCVEETTHPTSPPLPGQWHFLDGHDQVNPHHPSEIACTKTLNLPRPPGVGCIITRPTEAPPASAPSGPLSARVPPPPVPFSFDAKAPFSSTCQSKHRTILPLYSRSSRVVSKHQNNTNKWKSVSTVTVHYPASTLSTATKVPSLDKQINPLYLHRTHEKSERKKKDPVGHRDPTVPLAPSSDCRSDISEQQ